MANILRETHDITHYINPNPYMQKYEWRMKRIMKIDIKYLWLDYA